MPTVYEVRSGETQVSMERIGGIEIDTAVFGVFVLDDEDGHVYVTTDVLGGSPWQCDEDGWTVSAEFSRKFDDKDGLYSYRLWTEFSIGKYTHNKIGWDTIVVRDGLFDLERRMTSALSEIMTHQVIAFQDAFCAARNVKEIDRQIVDLAKRISSLVNDRNEQEDDASRYDGTPKFKAYVTG